MNTSKVVIFDMDGVIVDSVALMFERNRLEFPEATEEFLEQSFQINIFEWLASYTGKRLEETKEEKSVRLAEYYERKATAPLYDGMHDVIVALSSDYDIALVTSSSIKHGIAPLLREKLLKYFCFVGANEFSKSKVEKFRILSEQWGIPFDNMVFVTDTVGDLKEAEEVGIKTIMVSWGALSRAVLEKYKTTNLVGIVDSPEELLLQIHKSLA